MNRITLALALLAGAGTVAHADKPADVAAKNEAKKAAKAEARAAKADAKADTKSDTKSNKGASKVITTPSGLQYIDTQEGTGPSPQKGKQVTVHYTGTLASNGQKFDSSLDRHEPFSFVIGVGMVIPGWDEGVMSMKVGGKRKLMIPSKLGYGARGAGGVIPPNADLNFDVELLSVGK